MFLQIYIMHTASIADTDMKIPWNHWNAFSGVLLLLYKHVTLAVKASEENLHTF